MRMFYELPAGNFTVEEMLDKACVRELVETDRYCRDYGHFEQERACWFEDGKVFIETSPVVRMYANYGYRVAKPINAEAGELVTRAEFPWDEKYQWIRITIVDEHGKRACTNAYFPDQLKEEE